MPRALLALFLCLSPLPASAIIGGAQAPIEMVGTTVLIVSTRGASCSGAVLARDLVLTAAHCVQPAASYAVLAAPYPRLIEAAAIVLHPRFDPAQFKTRRPTPDLALVKLAEPLPPGFTPVRLARETALPRPGDRFTLLGWGWVSETDEKSAGRLRSVTLPAIGTTGGIMVRLSAGNGAGACTGDSGGPVFKDNSLVAIIGWTTGPKGPGCGLITGATLVALQREWIETAARELGSRIEN